MHPFCLSSIFGLTLLVQQKRSHMWLVVQGLFLWMVTAHCGTIPEQAHPTPAVVTFDQPVHFLTPQGRDTAVGPGLLRVGAPQGAALVLIPEGQGEPRDPVLVEAIPIDLGEALPATAVLHILWQHDEHHLIRLEPSGKGLEAIGSVTGIRSRGLTVTPLPASVIRDRLGRSK